MVAGHSEAPPQPPTRRHQPLVRTETAGCIALRSEEVVAGVFANAQVALVGRNRIRHRRAAQRIDVAVRVNRRDAFGLVSFGKAAPEMFIPPDVRELLEGGIAADYVRAIEVLR